MDGMSAGFAGAKTGHRGSAFCGCAVRLLRLTHAQPPASSRWRNHCAPSAIGRMAAPTEHPMKPGQVNPWTRHQRGQPGKEVQRAAVFPGWRGSRNSDEFAQLVEEPGLDAYLEHYRRPM